MITISFLEEIDGEPTSTPRNDVILASRRFSAPNELGPRSPEYYMPPQAQLAMQTYAEVEAQQAKRPPAFSVIINGLLLEKMRAEDGDFGAPHLAA